MSVEEKEFLLGALRITRGGKRSPLIETQIEDVFHQKVYHEASMMQEFLESDTGVMCIRRSKHHKTMSSFFGIKRVGSLIQGR